MARLIEEIPDEIAKEIGIELVRKFREGNRAYEKKEYKDALSLYYTIVKAVEGTDTLIPPVWNNRGAVFVELKRSKEAMQAFEQAFEEYQLAIEKYDHFYLDARPGMIIVLKNQMDFYISHGMKDSALRCEKRIEGIKKRSPI